MLFICGNKKEPEGSFYLRRLIIFRLFHSSLYPSPKLFKFHISIQALQSLVELFLFSRNVSGLPGQVGQVDVITICSRGLNGRASSTYHSNNQQNARKKENHY